MTGCGAEAGSSETTTCNSYETELGSKSSTTGNIYGVYDMSGGAFEYIMGNIVSNNESAMISGNSTSANSGYTGIIYSSGIYTSFVGNYVYPEGKYYDKYSFVTSYNQGIKSKLGDALKEVHNKENYGWYNDFSYMVIRNYPWFIRGGYYNSVSNAGLLCSNRNSGSAVTSNSSRFIIILQNNS